MSYYMHWLVICTGSLYALARYMHWLVICTGSLYALARYMHWLVCLQSVHTVLFNRLHYTLLHSHNVVSHYVDSYFRNGTYH